MREARKKGLAKGAQRVPRKSIFFKLRIAVAQKVSKQHHVAVCKLQRIQRRSTFPRGAGRACKTCRRPGPRCVLSIPSTHPASLSSEETSHPTSSPLRLTGAICRASTCLCVCVCSMHSPTHP